jgi:hypothetical protein
MGLGHIQQRYLVLLSELFWTGLQVPLLTDPKSECFESFGTKDRACTFNRFRAWRLNIVQSVVEV